MKAVVSFHDCFVKWNVNIILSHTVGNHSKVTNAAFPLYLRSVRTLPCANAVFLEIGILLHKMADSCSYPILGCPLRDISLLLSL